MTCVHLQQLFHLCKEHDLKIGAADLVRVVCRQCNEQEVCPSAMMDEYDQRHSNDSNPQTESPVDNQPE